MPFAVLRGAPQFTLPKDLYIPPDALAVFLDDFEGPLDLLLILIRRQNLDIVEIPIADITAQYMAYIDMMSDLRLELAAECLVMVSHAGGDQVAQAVAAHQRGGGRGRGPVRRADPPPAGVRVLQAARRGLHNVLPQLGRDTYPGQAQVKDKHVDRKPPDVDQGELLYALRGNNWGQSEGPPFPRTR